MTLTRTRTLEQVWPQEWSKTSKKRTNLVGRRTEMFSDHRVASKPVSAQHVLLLCKPACMLFAFSATVGVLSVSALLLIEETLLLLSVYRQDLSTVVTPSYQIVSSQPPIKQGMTNICVSPECLTFLLNDGRSWFVA